jgi:hypothetical protein
MSLDGTLYKMPRGDARAMVKAWPAPIVPD